MNWTHCSRAIVVSPQQKHVDAVGNQTRNNKDRKVMFNRSEAETICIGNQGELSSYPRGTGVTCLQEEGKEVEG